MTSRILHKLKYQYIKLNQINKSDLITAVHCIIKRYFVHTIKFTTPTSLKRDYLKGFNLIYPLDS